MLHQKKIVWAILCSSIWLITVSFSCIDYHYHLCVIISGTVKDSLTNQPIESVLVEGYLSKHVWYVDTTDASGAYGGDTISVGTFAGKEKIRELETQPPLRREEDWRFVFSKPNYKTLELLIPLELVYCSPHPQPAEIPEVRIPDVFLMPE
ncbi:MAG: hypothetical protein GTO24_09810 [candidate division Zixibacteria bacterium]|nr:hypothetical protein [candidate division Zixibacteria bacterium]